MPSSSIRSSDGLERGQVRVDVGDDRDGVRHARRPPRRWTGGRRGPAGRRTRRRGAQHRPDDVDPEVGPLAGGERGAERARRVHRRARDRPPNSASRPHRAADGDRCRGAHRARVGGDGHDHEHQEGRQHDLVDERAADADARDGRAELRGLVRPDREQHAARRRWRRPAARRCRRPRRGREVAAERERDRHGRVDVRAGEVAGRVDHHHDDQPEHEADADGAQRRRRTARRRRSRRSRRTRARTPRPLGGGAAARRSAR